MQSYYNMNNMDSEPADCWPIHGFNLSNNLIANDPVFICHSFNSHAPVQPVSDTPTLRLRDSVKNNIASFVGFGETPVVSNLPDPITNHHQNLVHVGNSVDVVARRVCKPFVGMEFDTIEASHVFWERYAHDTGFRARIRATSRRKRDGVIRTRTYVCAKEGKRGEDPRRTSSKRRPETRCGCGASMMVSLVKETGVYRVMTFVEEHNHGLDGKWNTPRLNNEVDLTCVEGQSACKPIVGMEFDTVDASGAFWEQYAHDVGFGARIRSTSKRKNDGVVRTRTYVCSREGTKYVDPRNLNSKPRSDTRCGCGALMTVSLDKEKWTYRVVNFIEEHNHELDDRRSIPQPKVPAQRVGKSQKCGSVVPEGSLPKMSNARDDEAQARATFVPNDAGSTVFGGPLLNLTNAQRMGILCTEFMQLAYRAVGSNEVFEGVRGLIRDGHSLADKY